jgi:PAS domain S-box-containing protein
MNSASPGDQVGSIAEDDRLVELRQELFDLESYILDLWAFSPVPLAYVNPVGIIMDASQALAALLGKAKNDLIGSQIMDYFMNPAQFTDLQNETREKGAISGLEVKVRRGANDEVFANISTMNRKDAGGDVIGYFISFFDLSKTRGMQGKLEEKVQELEEFHSLAVGRELKMIELEKNVNQLLKEMGRAPKFK